MSIHSCGLSHEGVQRALYAPSEVEALLGISHAMLYRLIDAGQLDARKLGRKTLITATSLRRFIDDLPKFESSLKEPVEAE